MSIPAIISSSSINQAAHLVTKTNNAATYCYGALAAFMLLSTTFTIVNSNSSEDRRLGLAGTVVLIIESLLQFAEIALCIDLASRIFGLPWKIFPDPSSRAATPS